MSTLLDAAGITFAYGQAAVLRDVALSLAPGEIVALLGPNGSGKSTLIQVLLGHLRGKGMIQWEGRPLRSWRRRDLARRIAYLPQSPGAQPQQTVLDTLRLGRAPYWQAFGVESPRDMEVVGEISSLLSLDDLLGRRMDEVSGGQRQRVFLGRCLVQEPRAMLLDEPNTFLDLRHQVEIGQFLRKLAAEKSLAILMASHDLNLAATFADRLVLLHNGAIAASGTAEEVLQSEILSRVYEVPMERIDRPGATPAVLPRM